MADFLRAIWDYPKASVPERYGRSWFHWFNDGLAAQASYAVQDALEAPRSTLIDPNTLSADGTGVADRRLPQP
jgi:prolyl oligopeptidase